MLNPPAPRTGAALALDRLQLAIFMLEKFEEVIFYTTYDKQVVQGTDIAASLRLVGAMCHVAYAEVEKLAA